MSKYKQATPEGKALLCCLRCPTGSVWLGMATIMVLGTIKGKTVRAAAVELGIDETRLSGILRRHPHLRQPELSALGGK